MRPLRGWVTAGIVRSRVQEERDDGVWWGHSSDSSGAELREAAELFN